MIPPKEDTQVMIPSSLPSKHWRGKARYDELARLNRKKRKAHNKYFKREQRRAK